ncbi:hypothetical protein D9M72_611450 [compost metagenome]
MIKAEIESEIPDRRQGRCENADDAHVTCGLVEQVSPGRRDDSQSERFKQDGMTHAIRESAYGRHDEIILLCCAIATFLSA